MNHGRYFSNTWWKKWIFCHKWTNNSKAKSSEETSSRMSPIRQILQFITKKCSWDKVDQEQWIKHLACDDDCLLLCNMLKIKTVTSFHSSNPLPLAFPELLSCLTLSISTLPLVLHMTLTLESNRTPTQWQTANHEIMISMAFGKKQLHGEQTELDRHIRGDVGSISTCAELHTRIASQSRRANTEWQTHSNLQAKYTLSFTLLAPDCKRKTRVFEENH